ncbi:hypothetical protein JCM8547_006318, partial [Rhodosporidiobolus lusitaniae]
PDKDKLSRTKMRSYISENWSVDFTKDTNKDKLKEALEQRKEQGFVEQDKQSFRFTAKGQQHYDNTYAQTDDEEEEQPKPTWQAMVDMAVRHGHGFSEKVSLIRCKKYISDHYHHTFDSNKTKEYFKTAVDRRVQMGYLKKKGQSLQFTSAGQIFFEENYNDEDLSELEEEEEEKPKEKRKSKKAVAAAGTSKKMKRVSK